MDGGIRSSRLGIFQVNQRVENVMDNSIYLSTLPERGLVLPFERGSKRYELTNHLGNVLATISDRKIAVTSTGSLIDYYEAEVISANDYYPFGMMMPGRKFSANGSYRYGFNGKEQDYETTGTTTYDYGFRIYNPSLGRFLSVDPLFKSYPWYTPYQFAGNKPIIAIDLDGLEELEVNVIDVFTITTDPSAFKLARTLAASNPTGLAILQQQSWNQIIVEINNIVHQQFDPNKNIDPDFLDRVKKSMYGYFGSNALSTYASYSWFANNIDLTSIQQRAMDKAFELANDFSRSRFFGEVAYCADIDKINQSKDPNTKANLIQERHERTTKNYQFIWMVNLWAFEMYGGFMGLGASNFGNVKSTNGLSLNNSAKYNSVDDLISDAGKLSRKKGGYKEGHVKGDAQSIFENLAKKYGAEIKSNGTEVFFKSGSTRVGLHYSSKSKNNTPTLHINSNSNKYKIRISGE